ncbi:MAG: hypothetical protein WCO66_00400 [Candidatus Absconditabacteria bacterium]
MMNEIGSEKTSGFQKGIEHIKQNKIKVGSAIAIVLGMAAGIYTYEHQKQQDHGFTTKAPQELVDKEIHDLYSYYLGCNGDTTIIGDSVYFQPKEIIDALYARKFSRPNKEHLKVPKYFYTGKVSKIDFTKFTPVTLDEYLESIDQNICLVQEHFDWKSFDTDYYKNDSTRAQLFKNICENIDGTSLLAYSMTELFPNPDGQFNKDFFAFLLKHGGTKFINNLPAIYDDLTSFGPYQFTYLAIYETPERQEGASNMNPYLPKQYQIPGSITKLEGDDHHKAAYLFAMYNIQQLTKHDNNLEALKLLAQPEHKNNLTQLIAIMHNMPSYGSGFLQERYKLTTDSEYLYKKTHDEYGKLNRNYDTNNNGKIDLYESKLRPILSHNYGKKTYYNKKAL